MIKDIIVIFILLALVLAFIVLCVIGAGGDQ